MRCWKKDKKKNKYMDNQNNETPGTPEEEIKNSVEQVLAGVDMEKITKEDVFHDLMHNSKLFSFRLMVASALLEQLHIRDVVKTEKVDDNVIRFDEQEQEPKS
jgi:hypothetical protein